MRGGAAGAFGAAGTLGDGRLLPRLLNGPPRAAPGIVGTRGRAATGGVDVAVRRPPRSCGLLRRKVCLTKIDPRLRGLNLRVHGRHHRAADETLEVQRGQLGTRIARPGSLRLPGARGCTGGYGLPASAKGGTVTGQVAIRRFRRRPGGDHRLHRGVRSAQGAARVRVKRAACRCPCAAPRRPGARAAMTHSMSLRTGGSSPVSPVRTPGCPGQGGKPDRSVC